MKHSLILMAAFLVGMLLALKVLGQERLDWDKFITPLTGAPAIFVCTSAEAVEVSLIEKRAQPDNCTLFPAIAYLKDGWEPLYYLRVGEELFVIANKDDSYTGLKLTVSGESKASKLNLGEEL